MQNALRKWLVGIGLMVALLALAVPALAQNQWMSQTTPATFPSPVQTMSLDAAGRLDIGTAGGGYPGGTLGQHYADPAWPADNFLGPDPALPAPNNDDVTAMLWDGGYLFAGTFNTNTTPANGGFYFWNGAVWTNPVLPAFVNKHAEAFAIDPTVAGVAGQPHMLYVGSWGDGVYTFDGATWTKLNLPGSFGVGAQFIHKLIVVPFSGACGGVHTNLTVYAATDGYGVIKGVQDCSTLAWTWTQDFTADLWVHSIARDVSGNIVVGTRSMGAYMFDGISWSAMATNVSLSGTIINDIVSDGANGFFAGTAGLGVFRYDATRGSWFQINTGYGVGFNLGDLYVNSVAWDAVNSYLYAGTGNLVPGSLGHVYRINLVPLVNCEPATRNVVAGTPDTNPICLTLAATGNPVNWFTEVTSGSLVPGLALSIVQSPYPPVVTISGTPTQDCSWPVVVTVWDALLNRTDVPITYLVQLGVAFSVNTTPTPLGTVMSFTSNVIGATGTVSYIWNFGDVLPFPTVDSTAANPTHIYTAPATYPVTLWVTDSACPGGAAACPAVSPDNCQVQNVEVYGPLTVDPNATIVGSGSQFQFHPTPFGSAMGGRPVCATPDGYTYDWRFYMGDPQNTSNELTWARSSLAEPVVTFTTTGAFWASLTVIDCSGHTAYGYCAFNYNGPMSVTISSNTNPADTITPVVFNGTAVGQGAFANYLFTIDFGDGSPVLGPVPPTLIVPVPTFIPLGHTYATPGTYTVTLTAQDDPVFGHTTIVHYQQTIYAAFTGITVTRTDGCTASYPGGHVAQSVHFTLTPIGGLPPYLLSVDWNDGSTQTISGITGPFPYSISHTYTTAGAYTPTFYMTDSGHIPVTRSQTSGPFYLANIPQGHITVNGGSCAEVVTPTATNIVLYNDTVLSTGFLATDFWYYMDYGDGTPIPGWLVFAGATQALAHNYVVPPLEVTHTYTLLYYLYNSKTCEQVGPYTATVTAFNPLVPPSPPTWTQSCGSRTVTFTAVAPTTGVPPYQLKWDFNDGTPPVNDNGVLPGATVVRTHTFALNGNYNCQLTVNDSYSANCGAVTIPNTVNTIYLVRVVEPISGTIAPLGPLTPGCAPQSVAFTSSMAGGAIVAPVPPFNPNPALNYTWSVSPGVLGVNYSFTPNNTVWNPTINFLTSGVYTVSLSVTSTTVPYTCSASNTVTVTVYAGMTPGSMSFTQTETSGYLPLNDTFTTTWAFGGVPSAPVTLVYHWDDGTADTTVNNAVSPDYTQHTFNIASGSLGYLVSVTATDACGNTQMFNRRIVILEPPVLGVTTSVTPTAGTAPFTAAFASLPTGGVSPYTFAWAFGDGGTSTAQNPTHIYAAAGVYTATLTVTDSYPAPNGPKTASASLTVTVYNTLTVNATGTPTNGSKPLTVNFASTPTGGNGTYTYLWYFGDGGNSALQNPTHVYNTAGTYFAYVVVSDTASHSGTSNQVVITAYDPLTVTANAVPNTGTLPLGVNFSAQANGGDQNYSFAWTFGDGGTATGALVNHIYTTMPSSGYVFTASVTVTDGVGHTATQNVPVTVYQPLTASISSGGVTTGTTPLLVHFTSTVAGGNGAYTYLWNFGDGTTANTANYDKTYTTAGNYSVTLQVTDTASHTVIANTINMTTWAPLTVASSATPTNIIVGQSITFTALAQGGNGIYTYTWTFGDSTTGTGATVNHMYAVGPRPSFTWTAHVVVTDTAGHSVTGADIVVTVRPVPPTILGAQKLVPPDVPSWRLKLIGTNFQNGVTVTISGTPVSVTFKNGGEIILKDCKSLCPKGVAVPIVATNPDGGISATFMYTRGPQP